MDQRLSDVVFFTPISLIYKEVKSSISEIVFGGVGKNFPMTDSWDDCILTYMNG